MFYQSELDYLMKVLRKMHIQGMLLDPGDPVDPRLDFGVRRLIGVGEGYYRAVRENMPRTEGNAIYRLRDEFMCSYVFLTLPGAPEEQILLIGPYATFRMEQEGMMEIAERLHIPAKSFPRLKEYYETIPVVANEMPLFALLTAFGEILWGSADAFELTELNTELPGADLVPEGQESLGTEGALLQMKLMETRYEYENELMEMVAQGQTHRAKLMLSGFSGQSLKQRLSDALRNTKNYAIICNTLFRKAAERGGVHPIHLDSISSEFARQIEALPTAGQGQQLMSDMASKYCRLVRKHSMKNYSPLIQQAVTCVESGLTGELSLSTLAATLNVNASYLSSTFKKETGQTVTGYINARRMKTGAHLLQTTRLQVQTIAQHCGISDVNYFSKLFKKHYGMTPKQFREQGNAEQKNR